MQLFRILTRPTVTDVTMKMRTSTGLSVSEYIGTFMRVQKTDAALSSIDADKVISCVIRNDQKLEAEKTGGQVHAQFAILFTTPEKERRIRVFNFHWQVASNFYGYFKSSDVEACAQFRIRLEAAQVVEVGAKAIRERIIEGLVDQMANYRAQCAQSTNPSQLVLPETLKRLPLYLLAGLKSPVSELLVHPLTRVFLQAFALLTRVQVDKKIAELYRLVSLPMANYAYFFYPRLYRITDLILEECDFGTVDETSGFLIKPRARQCRTKSLSLFEVYLIDNGEYLTILVGAQTSQEFLEEVFGVESLKQLRRSGNLPAFVPYTPEEGEEPSEVVQILQDLLEQMRYERADGAPPPIRVALTGDNKTADRQLNVVIGMLIAKQSSGSQTTT